jgi:transcriptional regulator with XRE-family HTH domain
MRNHTFIPTIIGESFQKARQAQGLSVSDLAIMATLSQNQIEQIESGGNKSFYSESIKIQSARKVAKILGLMDYDAFETKNYQQPALQLSEIEKTESVESSKVDLEEANKTNSEPKVESKHVLKIKKELSTELEKVSSIGTHLQELLAEATPDIGTDKEKKVSYSKVFSYLGGALVLVLVFLITQFNFQPKDGNRIPAIAPTQSAETQEPSLTQASKDIESVETIKTPTPPATTPTEAPR